MGRLEVREQILDCTKCDLHINGPVPFNGPTPAKYGVVGESPTAEDSETGILFSGGPGDLLRSSLTSAGLDPSEGFFWASAACCPKGTPTPEHVQACKPNFKAQLELCQAPFILALGSVAASQFIPNVKITQDHGQVLKENGQVILVTFHPAAALRKKEWHDKMNADIAKFAKVTKTDPLTDEWHHYFTGRCIVCGVGEEDMYEENFADNGLPYCEKHWLLRV